MLARERQERIVEEVRHRGSMRVVELAAAFEVSDMTIRRDLDVLQEQGLLEKVHGGAVLAGRSAAEPGFEAKLLLQRREKQAIARLAASLVAPGSSIALSAGTTTWHVARELARIDNLTIVTNCPSIALELYERAAARHQIMLTGGLFRTPSDALVGALADAAIHSLYVDLLFLGVHGMDPEAGFSTPNMAEAETDRTLIERARQAVVVADHTKWRTVGLCSIAPLSAADVLVSDAGLDEETRAFLEGQVGELLIADQESPDGKVRR